MRSSQGAAALGSLLLILGGGLTGCGGDGSASTARAEISHCYIDANGAPQAEVTLDGGDPSVPAYTATVDFHIVGDPDFADSFLVWLEAPDGSAHGTTEVSSSDPLLGGEEVTCVLKELRENSIESSHKVQGEGPEKPLE